MYSSDEVYRQQQAGSFDEVGLLHDIYRLKTLNHGLKLGVVQVLCHRRETSLRELARMVAPNAGERTVRTCIQELELAGYVITRHRPHPGGHGRLMYIKWKFETEETSAVH